MILTELEICKDRRGWRSKDGFRGMQLIDVCCDKCKHVFNSSYNCVRNNREKHHKDLCGGCRSAAANIANSSRRKGKTFEEILGTEKANKAREKLKLYVGERASNFGGKFNGPGQHIANAKRIGKTYDEQYGKEKGDLIKKKLSRCGEKNHMFGKAAPVGSGRGISGMYEGFHFRSTLELTFIKHLVTIKIPFVCGESKEYRVEYEKDGCKRNYYPDYVLGTGEIIEIKPSRLINSDDNKLKFAAAINLYRERFKVLTEKDFPTYKTELAEDFIAGRINLSEHNKGRFEKYVGLQKRHEFFQEEQSDPTSNTN